MFKNKKNEKLLKKINAKMQYYRDLSDDQLRKQTVRFWNSENLESEIVDIVATIREANYRILGKFAYDVQVLGGLAIINGDVVEMDTGEGKTLTATLALYFEALKFKTGVFLITPNAYLASRDGTEMGEVFKWLGLSVGIRTGDEEFEDAQVIYQNNIVYITNSALGFDYLQNNLISEKKAELPQYFNFALLDEIDSILLDMAQSPLVISGNPKVTSSLYRVAQIFISFLVENVHYEISMDKKKVWFVDEGIRKIEQFFSVDNVFSNEYKELLKHLKLALDANVIYRRDYEYIVDDGKIVLLDQKTGRTMLGTKLQNGLHQAIEMKENVEITNETAAMASVTYQNLFRMFTVLSGMSGTGKNAKDEFIETYNMSVSVIPRHIKSSRVDHQTIVFTTFSEKISAMIELVMTKHKIGQPILLIAETMKTAELISKILLANNIQHNLLHAQGLQYEAEIIARAGQLNSITIATSLAGRGTDIKLSDEARQIGGLAVILSEKMENVRIERQVIGRSARQGDPGETYIYSSLQDTLLIENPDKYLQRYQEKKKHKKMVPITGYAKLRAIRAYRKRQLLNEDSSKSARFSTLQYDEVMRRQRTLIYEVRYNILTSETFVKNLITSFKSSSTTEEQKQINMLESFLESLEDSQKNIINMYRVILLRSLDESWMEQVEILQELKSVVSDQALINRNVLFEYNKLSIEKYDGMLENIQRNFTINLKNSEIDLDDLGKINLKIG
ncbi:DEAD/DEAH box helicase [Weissella diestrammenae]|uniref:Protein translocase subunit SecA n=1 Tax=Weissella diestrammenae TaxID=1162633 RepID=A0A7G9T5H7_9LACO|nr:DEAD/DEAH box helicase [Weissella diestrammenae]MCM0583213.1 DEAD/DEAH box helicase [Weissella diestrammenae]QNN75352.1 DEAD/DEAH box helicase [Weissella diestrammenae]